LKNLLGFIVMIGKSDGGPDRRMLTCCCWCCFYVIDDWSWIWCWLQEYAGFRTDFLPMCWINRQLVDLVFSWMIWSLVSLFWFTFLFLMRSLITIENILIFDLVIVFGLGKKCPKRDSWCCDEQVEPILTCSRCLIGVGPVICWFRCGY